MKRKATTDHHDHPEKKSKNHNLSSLALKIFEEKSFEEAFAEHSTQLSILFSRRNNVKIVDHEEVSIFSKDNLFFQQMRKIQPQYPITELRSLLWYELQNPDENLLLLLSQAVARAQWEDTLLTLINLLNLLDYSVKKLLTRSVKHKLIKMIDEDIDGHLVNLILELGNDQYLQSLCKSRKITDSLLRWRHADGTNLAHLAIHYQRKPFLNEILTIKPDILSIDPACLKLILEDQWVDFLDYMQQHPSTPLKGLQVANRAAAGNALAVLNYLDKHHSALLTEADLNGLTPLVHAVMHSNSAAFQWLADHKHDLNWRDDQENNLVHYCGQKSDSKDIFPILQHLAAGHSDLFNTLNKYDEIPLMAMIQHNAVNGVQYITQFYPTLTKRHSAILTAIKHERIEILPILYRIFKNEFSVQCGLFNMSSGIFALTKNKLQAAEWLLQNCSESFGKERSRVLDLLVNALHLEQINAETLHFVHKNFPDSFGEFQLQPVLTIDKTAWAQSRSFDPMRYYLVVDSQQNLYLSSRNQTTNSMEFIKLDVYGAIIQKILAIPIINETNIPIELAKELFFKRNLFSIIVQPVKQQWEMGHKFGPAAEIPPYRLYMQIFDIPFDTDNDYKASPKLRSTIEKFTRLLVYLTNTPFFPSTIGQMIFEYCPRQAGEKVVSLYFANSHIRQRFFNEKSSTIRESAPAEMAWKTIDLDRYTT